MVVAVAAHLAVVQAVGNQLKPTPGQTQWVPLGLRPQLHQ